METIVLTTGGFDPIHVGHVRLFQDASTYGKLIVGLNSDEWLVKKKGKPFMERDERREILLELKSISEVIAFEDDEIGSAGNAIERVYGFYRGTGAKLIFAKGGDRNAENIPEVEICNRLGVEIIYGVGGNEKPQSSSRLLRNWSNFAKSEG